MEYIKKFNNLEEFHSYEESGKMVFPRLILIDEEDQIRYKYPVNKRDNWIVFSYVPMTEFNMNGFGGTELLGYYECYSSADYEIEEFVDYCFEVNDYNSMGYFYRSDINEGAVMYNVISNEDCNYYALIIERGVYEILWSFPETNTFETESELYNYYIMVFPIRFGYYASGDIFYRHLYQYLKSRTQDGSVSYTLRDCELIYDSVEAIDINTPLYFGMNSVCTMNEGNIEIQDSTSNKIAIIREDGTYSIITR